MYGWRARLGLLVPKDNAVVEPEFAGLCLEGVACYATRLRSYGRPAMPEEAVEVSVAFGSVDVDAIGYACAETGFVEGQEANRWLAGKLEQATGKPALTATGAVVEALTALSAGTVALAAPYPPDWAEALQAFMERSGFRVSGIRAQQFSAGREGASTSAGWAGTNRQRPSAAYQLAREADSPAADAVVLSATNLRTFEIVGALERDLGKPVVTTNAALLWALLGRCGVTPPARDLGILWSRPAQASRSTRIPRSAPAARR